LAGLPRAISVLPNALAGLPRAVSVLPNALAGLPRQFLNCQTLTFWKTEVEEVDCFRNVIHTPQQTNSE
jgi:hypothetical protein